MADTRLHDFINSALRAGKSRDEIRAVLSEAGWPPEQIEDGLEFFADLSFAVPVPKPRAQLSARDAFLYLLMFGTLYVSAYQLGSLLFDFINLAFPDELDPIRAQAAGRGIRWSIASLVVAFPAFLWISLKLNGEVAADPTRRQSAVRRWLTYFTLLIAAGVIVGDLITLVFNLLSGDLTAPFVLKVLVVALIVGTVFGYYMSEIRNDDERR